MGITDFVFKNDSRKKLKKAEKQLDKAGQALKDAKTVFDKETDKALETVQRPMKEKQLAQQTIEQAQAELSETVEFNEIADLIEQIETHKQYIKAYEVQHENLLQKDNSAVMQAFVELTQAQANLRGAIKAFEQSIEPFINEDNKDDLNGVISDYKGLFYDTQAVGRKLDRLNMLEADSLGTQHFKSIILPDGTKKSFRNL